MNKGLILLPNAVVVAIVKASEKTESNILDIYRTNIENYALYIADFIDYVALISVTGEIIMEVLKIEFERLLEESDCIRYVHETAKKIIGINASTRGSVREIINCFNQNNINLKEDLPI